MRVILNLLRGTGNPEQDRKLGDQVCLESLQLYLDFLEQFTEQNVRIELGAGRKEGFFGFPVALKVRRIIAAQDLLNCRCAKLQPLTRPENMHRAFQLTATEIRRKLLGFRENIDWLEVALV